MIIFQITLTGPMLQYLAALKHQEEAGASAHELLYADGRFVTTMQALIRQGLASHESPVSDKRNKDGEREIKWATKGRRFHYEITPKGLAALQLAGFDLHEFLGQVTKGLPPPGEAYTAIYKEMQSEGARPVPAGRGRRSASS